MGIYFDIVFGAAYFFIVCILFSIGPFCWLDCYALFLCILIVSVRRVGRTNSSYGSGLYHSVFVSALY